MAERFMGETVGLGARVVGQTRRVRSDRDPLCPQAPREPELTIRWHPVAREMVEPGAYARWWLAEDQRILSVEMQRRVQAHVLRLLTDPAREPLDLLRPF